MKRELELRVVSRRCRYREEADKESTWQSIRGEEGRDGYLVLGWEAATLEKEAKNIGKEVRRKRSEKKTVTRGETQAHENKDGVNRRTREELQNET